MGKRVIAEFVENEEIVHVLADIGVDFAQGYHIGRPALPLSDRPRSPQRPLIAEQKPAKAIGS
jgi:EAL domain-containing protein (putative c-di-GMP-specific phosphodiesterase class I)